MSHMTLEYSSNLRAAGRFGELCRKLAQYMVDLKIERKAVFPPGGVRVRAIPCDDFCIADGSIEDAGFVHAILKIGAGRSEPTKQATCTACCAAECGGLTRARMAITANPATRISQ